MRSYFLPWLIVSTLAGPFLSSAQTTPSTPPTAAKPSPEATAQKQRETTLAAMQASIEKQKAAVAASVSASIGKQGQTLAPKDSFFTLSPLAPPPQNVAAQASMPDIACDPVPEESVAPILMGAAQREGLDPKLLTAVIQQESGFRPCAISDKGAEGLMQLMPDTSDRFSVKDPFDSKQNIDAGAKYLKELITKYSGNLGLALGAYNAGPEAVDQAGGIPNIPETTDYVKSILTKLGLDTTSGQTPAPVTDPVPPTAPQQ